MVAPHSGQFLKDGVGLRMKFLSAFVGMEEQDFPAICRHLHLSYLIFEFGLTIDMVDEVVGEFVDAFPIAMAVLPEFVGAAHHVFLALPVAVGFVAALFGGEVVEEGFADLEVVYLHVVGHLFTADDREAVAVGGGVVGEGDVLFLCLQYINCSRGCIVVVGRSGS
jgi:hypothetical protein